MASIFEQTIVPKLNFSNFPLNEWQLVSLNFGQIVPVYVRDVLPNDVYTLTAFQNIEFAPMVAPMFHEVHASLHFFFVPSRVVYEDFETFITGAEDGHVLSEEDIPAQMGIPKKDFKALMDDDPSVQGTLFDYFGLPNNICGETTSEEIISDELLRDYFKIWYDYYRDENLQVDVAEADELTYYDFWRNWKRNSKAYNNSSQRTDFRDAMNQFLPFYRSYRKDYFTAALPTPQKGEPVSLSLGLDAPVTFSSEVAGINLRTEPDQDLVLQGVKIDPSNGGTLINVAYPQQLKIYNNDPDNPDYYDIDNISGAVDHIFSGNYVDSNGDIVNNFAVADLRRASAVTVEQLREAFAVQEILESLSMRGSRFTEFLKGNFGVTPDDYRLQRAQFLGGIVSPVQIQSVIQQSGYSGEDSRDMTGYAAGRAFASARDRVFRMRFKEHGYIIGLASVMPKSYYYQGIPRHFLRHDRFDYYLPQTAHLGEQAIENQELYYTPGNEILNKGVFGFIPRWAEYKTSLNGIHGDFRGNLNYYHMARVFGSTPTLSQSFISTLGLQTRPFAVWKSENPGISHLIWCQYYFKVVASRPMPYHSIPKVL